VFQATELTERNHRRERLVRSMFLAATLLLIVPVGLVLGILVWRGSAALSMDFLLTEPRDGMTAGGIFPALVGTIWLVVVALIASVPIGVAAALYLSEYARDNWLTRLINLAIINLLNKNVHPTFIAENREPLLSDPAFALGARGNSIPGRAFTVGLALRIP